MSRADDLAELERGLAAMRGLNNIPITADKVLSAHETGMLLVDASSGAVTVTLPPANRLMDIRIQRIDNSANRLVVQAAGSEAVRFHTHLRQAGYGFFVLLGAGDYWHLRSDGEGAWRLLDRQDGTPLGRLVFESTTAFSPGGWGALNGALLNRADWPWLWDHAQASGMLATEATRVGREGGWTSGDGATTFRSPDGRGEFLRVLDEARGVDSARTAGSSQIGSYLPGDNNLNDEIIYVHDSTDKAGLGWEPFMGAPAAGTVRYSPTQSGSTPNPAPLSSHSGAARPRNIAYPARIKMI
ncbi:tail fiber protein [Pseudomonas sp. UFMG81]|jgi:hypothetical protein|uniref:tail fiber protein n=1 Tax=Pseudomonas sp. UFMG81 TaxID=2745936 RepID=UPI00188E6561|nr:tail fiber protein [Pseudomonas sp. UFMG81]